MSTAPPPLPLHDLNYPTEAPFWTAEDNASTRRVFLVPVSPPSDFVAFGVLGLGSPVQVRFVAQGKVPLHLGAFIERMVREGARVELYVWPPLPAELVEQYATIPPYEGHEYEAPPGSPVRGMSASSSVEPYSRLRDSTLWTKGDVSSRYTYLVPLSDASQFLALGVSPPSATVVFAARGTLHEDLGPLISHVLREQSRVELHARPPLPQAVLDLYLTP